MIVVPTGGNVTVPLLGCGPTDWWAFADAVGDDPLLVAVDCAVAEDAGALAPDDPLLAGAEPEPEPAAEVEVSTIPRTRLVAGPVKRSRSLRPTRFYA